MWEEVNPPCNYKSHMDGEVEPSLYTLVGESSGFPIFLSVRKSSHIYAPSPRGDRVAESVHLRPLTSSDDVLIR